MALNLVLAPGRIGKPGCGYGTLTGQGKFLGLISIAFFAGTLAAAVRRLWKSVTRAKAKARDTPLLFHLPCHTSFAGRGGIENN